MAKKYIKVYLDLLEALEPFGDAERGRLFTALLEYGRTGAAPGLSGNERFLFPMIRAQLDRDGASYDARCETNAANGKKGGAPSGNSNAKKKQPKQAKQPKTRQDKDEDKDKDKKEISPVGDIKKTAIAAVMTAYMDKITATPSERSLDELKGYVGTMGAECCLRAIDEALDAKAANWNYIRKILQTKASQGVRCIADWDRMEAERREKHGSSDIPGAGPGQGAGSDWKLDATVL